PCMSVLSAPHPNHLSPPLVHHVSRRRQLGPLFPYTPLFRSPSPRRLRACSARSASLASTAAPPARRRPATLATHGRSRRAARSLDRKSTRLNSSHVKISYAVFCLKKKIYDFF